jgi:hypothetical protein
MVSGTVWAKQILFLEQKVLVTVQEAPIPFLVLKISETLSEPPKQRIFGSVVGHESVFADFSRDFAQLLIMIAFCSALDQGNIRCLGKSRHQTLRMFEWKLN